MKNDKIVAFSGQVRCTGLNIGTGKWKSGSLVLEESEGGAWLMRVVYDCGVSRSFALTASSLSKATCKETGCYIDIQDSNTKDFISVSYRPSPAVKKSIGRLQSIMAEIRSPKSSSEYLVSKCEVGLKAVDVTPVKSGLYSSIGTNASANNENTGNNFTCVKPIKREESDEKENLLIENMGNEQFLQRSSDKSRQTLSTLGFYGKSSSTTSTPIFRSSTPNRGWLNTKRGPGLMADPTPIKRPRLLSDSISYSMKPKQQTTATDTGQQTLQGFSNLGNTCYMNAILQSLFGLDTFSTDLASNKRLFRSIQPQSLYHALVKLLYVRRQQNSSDIARKDCLRRVKSAISNTARRFLGYGQHDAHEFLCQVLDQLKEEVLKVSKTTPTPNKENGGGDENGIDPASQIFGQNPITINFEFEVLHTLTCLQCSEQVCKTEQFHDISLDVPKHKNLLTPRSLQDALSMFFRSEQIEYTCEKCGHNETDVSHKITKLPRVFILHLKRYTYSQTFAKNRKMGMGVSVPTYLTIQNHCTEATQPAYPPELHNITASEAKSNGGAAGLNDSREDTPSRRKLEYPGFRFKNNRSVSTDTDKNNRSVSTDTDKNNRSVSTDTDKGKESLFTETKPKQDEMDSGMAEQAIPLEYDDVSEIARAIELSLKEQEHRHLLCDEFREDADDSFQHALHMSTNTGERKKSMEELTFEEQMEIAIQQSLLDSDHKSNNTQFDDVTTHSDDVITMSDHMYTKSSSRSTMTQQNHDEGYPESYDIGPDEDDNNYMSASIDQPMIRKRSNSDSIVLQNRQIELSDDVIFTSKETPPHIEIISDADDVAEGIFSADDDSVNNSYTDKNLDKSFSVKHGDGRGGVESEKSSGGACEILHDGSRGKYSEKLQNLAGSSTTEDSGHASSDDTTDLLCTEEMPEEFENEAAGVDGDRDSDKTASSTYELSGMEGGKQNGKDVHVEDGGTIITTKCSCGQSKGLEGSRAADSGQSPCRCGSGSNNRGSNEASSSRGGMSSNLSDSGRNLSDSSRILSDSGRILSDSSSYKNRRLSFKARKLFQGETLDNQSENIDSVNIDSNKTLDSSENCDFGTNTGDDVKCNETKVDIHGTNVDNGTQCVINGENGTKEGKSENKEKGTKRKCQLSNNEEADLMWEKENQSFMEEDDEWMSTIDDKENKIPDNIAEVPTLSDPTEFDADVLEKGGAASGDETDGMFVEETLDLPEINNEKGDMPYSYRLVSIVNHVGLTSTTGHYISDVYDMHKKSWFSFDDSHVSKIAEIDVRTKRERSGYIFFYMSKDIFDDLSQQYSTISTAKK